MSNTTLKMKTKVSRAMIASQLMSDPARRYLAIVLEIRSEELETRGLGTRS
jgi:hypothetical protein